MASFKGDGRYRSHYDDRRVQTADSDSDEAALDDVAGFSLGRRDPERVWVEENYDVLEELYRAFRESGSRVFGAAFFQCGGFHHFTHLIYTHTHLLKA